MAPRRYDKEDINPPYRRPYDEENIYAWNGDPPEPPDQQPVPQGKTPPPSEWLRDDFRAYWESQFSGVPWDPESWVNDPEMVRIVNETLNQFFFHGDPYKPQPPGPLPEGPPGPPTPPVPPVVPKTTTPYSQAALQALFRKYPATNVGIRQAFEEIKGLGWNVSLLEHPTRLDKIRLPNGQVIDVIVGATGTSGEWGWQEGEGGGGAWQDYTGEDLEEPFLGQLTKPPGWVPPSQTAGYDLPPVPELDLPTYEAPAPFGAPDPFSYAPLAAPEPFSYEAFAAPDPFSYAAYETPEPFAYADWNAPEPFTPPSGEGVFSDPGFQFRLKLGQQALERSAAARGTLLTGGTLKGLMDYSQELASEEYGNVYGRSRDVYGINTQNAWDAYRQNLEKAEQTYGTNVATRAESYDRNRENAFQNWLANFERRASSYDRSRKNAYENYLANWGITSDVYGTNRAGAMDQYRTNYDIGRDVYGINVRVGQQAYENAYQAALAQFAPKLTEWGTRAQLGTRASELDYARRWNEYLTAYDIFKENQDRPFGKLFSLTGLGLQANA